jgi:hypothetical protein
VTAGFFLLSGSIIYHGLLQASYVENQGSRSISRELVAKKQPSITFSGGIMLNNLSRLMIRTHSTSTPSSATAIGGGVTTGANLACPGKLHGLDQ